MGIDTIGLLKTTELFQSLSTKELLALASRITVKTYQAGQIIFDYGQPGSSMFIIVKGYVNIYLPGEASRRLSLKDLSYGEYFGELSLFDCLPRSASALATTTVELLELTREALFECIGHHPNVAIVLFRTMAIRLRETNTLLSQRVAKNYDEEMKKQLTWKDRLADRVAELNGSWKFIIIIVGITSAWMIINSHSILKPPFDPYPYVFFNLVLAILVALQGPLIVMSQNRQVLKDRTQAKIDYEINLKNEVNIETLLRELGELRLEINQRLQTLENAANCPPMPEKNHERNHD